MKSPIFAALVLSGTVSIYAQPSATMRPSLLASVASSLSYSSKEALTYRDAPMGEVAVQHFAFSVSRRYTLNEDNTLVYGLAYGTHELAVTGALLPARLAELSLNVGWQHSIDRRWKVSFYLRPGFYGDFEDVSGQSFNTPALALATFIKSRELVWSFGLNANPFSDNPVFPVLGVRWQFAPRWTFEVGFPRSGFAWQATDDLTLRAGVGFQGGSFRITQNLGVPAPGVARLANTYVDYREIQAGIGADLEFNGSLAIALDLGAVTDRKFDYFDRDYRLDGDAGFYVTLALKASF